MGIEDRHPESCIEQEILELTRLWCQMVNTHIHHKSGDCHWHINKVWSRGDDPYYRVEHFGYLYYCKNDTEHGTYRAALEDLVKEIHKGFSYKLGWAKSVLGGTDPDYYQAKSAKWIVENIEPVIEKRKEEAKP